MNQMEPQTFTTFNTHMYVKKIMETGLNEPQAEAIINAIINGKQVDTSTLATKEDIHDLDAKITTLILDTKAQFYNLDAKVDKVANNLNAKIDKSNAALDAKIDKVANNLESKIAKLTLDTKEQFHILDAQIDNITYNLEVKIAKVESKVDSVEANLRAEIQKSHDNLRIQIQKNNARTLRWFISTSIALAAIIISTNYWL